MLPRKRQTQLSCTNCNWNVYEIRLIFTYLIWFAIDFDISIIRKSKTMVTVPSSTTGSDLWLCSKLRTILMKKYWQIFHYRYFIMMFPVFIISMFAIRRLLGQQFEHYTHKLSIINRSSRPEVFYKKDVLRNFAKFTGKQMRQSQFFNKISGWDSAQVFSCEFQERLFL